MGITAYILPRRRLFVHKSLRARPLEGIVLGSFYRDRPQLAENEQPEFRQDVTYCSSTENPSHFGEGVSLIVGCAHSIRCSEFELVEMLINQREFDEALARLKGDVPDADDYALLCQIYLCDPIVDELNSLDPFSRNYRETAMRLYKKLRRSETYDPSRDEFSQMAGVPDDLWRGVSPWSFRSPKMISEFLLSWGHIMSLLDLSSGAVLEYGSGSGVNSH